MFDYEIKNLLNICYPKEPRNVPELANNLISEFNVDIIKKYEDDLLIGIVFIIKFNNLLYGISNLCVHPQYRKQGYARNLMKTVHNKYNGIFVLKTHNPEIYKNLGYKKFKNRIMIFSNINSINF